MPFLLSLHFVIMSHNLKEDNFKIVSYKRKQRKSDTVLISLEQVSGEGPFEKERALRRIFAAKEEILSSDFYSSIKASLTEGLQILGKPKIKEIVCFGLGKFVECMISRYQLALLLCLNDLYHASIYSCDPAFGSNEHKILEHFGINLIADNIEGKYRSKESSTIFFLPHCPKQLSNNLLWANWGLKLSSCIIIGNSFNKILESNTKRIITNNAGYLLNISPYLIELAVINSFKYYDIFNDSAIHIFPFNKLSMISNDLWSDCKEPNYILDDIEFITKKVAILSTET